MSMHPRDFPPDAPMCASGKRPFRTEADAAANLTAAHRLRRNHSDETARRPGVVEHSYYRCPSCEWWHLRSGSQVVDAKGRPSKARGRRSRR